MSVLYTTGKEWPEFGLALCMFILLIMVAVYVVHDTNFPRGGLPEIDNSDDEGTWCCCCRIGREDVDTHYTGSIKSAGATTKPRESSMSIWYTAEEDEGSVSRISVPSSRGSSMSAFSRQSKSVVSQRSQSQQGERRKSSKSNSERNVFAPDGSPLHLDLKRPIGKGNFGLVIRAAVWNKDRTKKLYRAAVKKPRDRYNDEITSYMREKACRQDIYNELDIRRRLTSNHPCLVKSYGGRTSTDNPLIILELLEGGSLQGYLTRKRKGRRESLAKKITGEFLHVEQLIQFAIDIGKGVEFLSNHRIIHRDLATRNVLLNHAKSCKISDLGMSRYLKVKDGIFRQKEGIFPYRWMAPESIEVGDWSLKTDVWSYGVTLWEIVTCARKPYGEMTTKQVKQYVISGEKLEKPVHCSSGIYKQMISCWAKRPSQRPEIGDVARWFEKQGRRHTAEKHIHINEYDLNVYNSDWDLVKIEDRDEEKI